MEKVILVDLNDVPLGEMEKMEAHRKALLHRAVSVFVFNSENKMLLQQRALNKYHSPGLWTNTACTHPYPNEANDAAAIRRAKEEMGLTLSRVQKIFDFTYKEQLDDEMHEYEFDHVFVAFSDSLPLPEPNEVADYKYIDLDVLLTQVAQSPELYTVWFRKIVAQVVSDVSKLMPK